MGDGADGDGDAEVLSKMIEDGWVEEVDAADAGAVPYSTYRILPTAKKPTSLKGNRLLCMDWNRMNAAMQCERLVWDVQDMSVPPDCDIMTIICIANPWSKLMSSPGSRRLCRFTRNGRPELRYQWTCQPPGLCTTPVACKQMLQGAVAQVASKVAFKVHCQVLMDEVLVFSSGMQHMCHVTGTLHGAFKSAGLTPVAESSIYTPLPPCLLSYPVGKPGDGGIEVPFLPCVTELVPTHQEQEPSPHPLYLPSQAKGNHPNCTERYPSADKNTLFHLIIAAYRLRIHDELVWGANPCSVYGGHDPAIHYTDFTIKLAKAGALPDWWTAAAGQELLTMSVPLLGQAWHDQDLTGLSCAKVELRVLAQRALGPVTVEERKPTPET
eukprot:gene1122-56_t